MRSKKVLVGISGGVDSTIATHLLQKEGYEVETLFINTCNNDPIEAKEVAHSLNVPFHTIDMNERFNKYVIQYFIDTYKKGQTPNPCVICNRYVKFQALIDVSKELQIPFVATGHYAKVEYHKKKNRYLLKKGADFKKDQSYMLYNLTQEQLSKAIFPLGKYKKTKIREIAKSLNLKVADKPDSQDICFIPNSDYSKYIQKNTDIEDKEGNIVDMDGNTIGRHKGITKYTIGQRKGIKTDSNKPLYVVDIDIAQNQIIVGEEENIYSKDLKATNLNWISITELKKRMSVKAKIRYSTKEYRCTIKPSEKNTVSVRFSRKQRAITPGQAIVFYKGNTVVGGGLIE